MEGVAAASSIIAIIHVSSKIISRIEECSDVANGIPQYLRHIENKLTLLKTVSKQIEIRCKNGSIESCHMRGVEPMLRDYGQHIEELENILLKLIPTSQDGAWRRTKNIVRSIAEEKKVENIIKIVDDCVHYLNFFLTSTATNFQPQSDDKLLDILNWLDAPDPSTNHDKALESQLERTGLWFLNGEAFTKWKTGKASRIWLYGIPGCGKSVLSSAIIHHLSHLCDKVPGKVIIYYYFDFSDKQKQCASSMLRSFICQLAQSFHKIPKDLDKAFTEFGKKRKSLSQKGLLELFKQIVKEFPQIYVVLDALDECVKWGELLKVLEDIFNWEFQHMHFIMTSRREKQIEDVLEDIKGPREHICIMNDAVDEDIKLYISHELSSRKSLRKKSNKVKAEIERALTAGAKGMFRWAVCQIDELEKCVNEKMIRKALSSLPRTLDETYERILSAISDEHSDYVIRILRWLASSARPITLKEVTEIAALDPFRDPEPAFAEEEVLDDERSVLSLCSSLVAFTEDTDDIVALAHYSVKEYLISERSRVSRYSLYDLDCNDFIATSCLKYYLQLLQPNHLNENQNVLHALKRYIMEYWRTHCQLAAEKSSHWILPASKLLSTGAVKFIGNRICSQPEDSQLSSYLHTPPALYASISLELNNLAIFLLENEEETRIKEGLSYSWSDIAKKVLYNHEILPTLHLAVRQGNEQLVSRLLDKGADINCRDFNGKTCFHYAVLMNNCGMTLLLLKRGADVNQIISFKLSALHIASEKGYKQMVELLLEKGADVNLTRSGECSALALASRRGHKQIVELLLEKGADIDLKGGVFGSAFYSASYSGQKHIVELFLRKKREMKDTLESNLSLASRNGNKEVVKSLLANGAGVNKKDCCKKALNRAAYHGQREVVELLLRTRAKEIEGEVGSALNSALLEGHNDVVELLLQNCVDDQQDELRGALWKFEGYDALSRVDIPLASDQRAIALRDISAWGSTELLEECVLEPYHCFLLDKLGDALNVASAYGQKEIVELLLEKYVNEVQDNLGSALKIASAYGENEIAEFLHRKSAEASTKNRTSKTCRERCL